MAVGRGALVTVGQIAFYEQVKQMLLATSYFHDNVITHFSASFVAGNIMRTCHTFLCIFDIFLIYNSRWSSNFVDNAA